MRSRYGTLVGSAAILVCCALMTVTAQPSGGPYGPVRQTYKIPQTGHVYYVAVDGLPSNSGESLTTPTTLESAIERVRTGGAIVLRGGTYRTGNLILNQGVTIQPYEDEEPVLKGTYVANHWKNLRNGLWKTTWTRLFPSKPQDWWRRDVEGKFTPPWRFNNDMVFFDGRFLQAVGWEGEVNENTYFINYEDSTVYIGSDPTNHLVEITAFDVALLRTTGECQGKKSDGKGYTIRGITFTQYAYRALEIEGTEPVGLTDESKFGKDVTGSTLENCTITYCSRVAGYFRGNHLTIRHCKVSDTSTEGVYVIGSNDILLEGNIFQRNNIENITGYYPAAVKIFNQCHRAVCRDNLVTDLPNSNGIWSDVGDVDGVFVNNWVQNVGTVSPTTPTNQLWPSSNGFFFEISKGAICAGNVFLNCDHGMMILNSSNVKVYQNTFVNSMACFGRNGRVAAGDHFGWHASTGPDVAERGGHAFVNNLLTGDANFTRPLLFVWQPDSLCARLRSSQLKDFDHNAYVRANAKAPYPLILWSPMPSGNCQSGFESSDELRKVFPTFEVKSETFPGYDGPLFKSAVLGNFEIERGFPGSRVATEIPKEISKALGPAKRSARTVGAYPVNTQE